MPSHTVKNRSVKSSFLPTRVQPSRKVKVIAPNAMSYEQLQQERQLREEAVRLLTEVTNAMEAMQTQFAEMQSMYNEQRRQME